MQNCISFLSLSHSYFPVLYSLLIHLTLEITNPLVLNWFLQSFKSTFFFISFFFSPLTCTAWQKCRILNCNSPYNYSNKQIISKQLFAMEFLNNWNLSFLFIHLSQSVAKLPLWNVYGSFNNWGHIYCKSFLSYDVSTALLRKKIQEKNRNVCLLMSISN